MMMRSRSELSFWPRKRPPAFGSLAPASVSLDASAARVAEASLTALEAAVSAVKLEASPAAAAFAPAAATEAPAAPTAPMTWLAPEPRLTEPEPLASVPAALVSRETTCEAPPELLARLLTTPEATAPVAAAAAGAWLPFPAFADTPAEALPLFPALAGPPAWELGLLGAKLLTKPAARAAPPEAAAVPAPLPLCWLRLLASASAWEAAPREASFTWDWLFRLPQLQVWNRCYAGR
jgi:hypothetical protein